MSWKIKIVKPHPENQIKEKSYELELDNDENIYEIIKKFEKDILNRAGFENVIKSIEEIKLGEIINLHDSEGIRDISQIKKMAEDIKSGNHIFNRSGIPNIKLIKSDKEELVLFDGHHSILAYMLNDKKCLNEIPHLIVERGKRFNDEKIKEFFIEHKDKLNDKNWREHTINWQACETEQLCKRKEKNIGEVFRYLNLD